MSTNQNHCNNSLAEKITLHAPKTLIPLNLKNAKVSHSSALRRQINMQIDEYNLPDVKSLNNEPYFSINGHILFQTFDDIRKYKKNFNDLIKYIPNVLYIYLNTYGESHGLLSSNIKTKLADIFDLILIGCFFQSSLIKGGHFFIHANEDSIVRVPIMKQTKNTYNVFIINGKKYYRPVTSSMIAIVPSHEYINKNKPNMSYSTYLKEKFDYAELNFIKKWNFDDSNVLKILKMFFSKPVDEAIEINDTYFVPIRIEFGTDVVYFNSNKSNIREDKKIINILFNFNNIPPFNEDTNLWNKLKFPVKLPSSSNDVIVGNTKKFETFTLSETLFSGPYPSNLGFHTYELSIDGISGVLPLGLIKYTNVVNLNLSNCNFNFENIYIPTNLKKLSIINSNIEWKEIMKVVSKCKKINFLEVNNLELIDLTLLKNWILNTEIEEELLELIFTNISNFIYPENFNYLIEFSRQTVLSFSFNTCTNVTGVDPCFLAVLPVKLNVEFNQCSISTFVIRRLRENRFTWTGTDLTINGLYITEEEDEEVDEVEIDENKIKFSVTHILNEMYLHYKQQDPPTFSVITEFTCDDSLIKWLNRLFAETKNDVKIIQDLIPDVLNMIETMDSNSEFLEESCNIINDATESCGDRVILSILYISMQYALHTLQPELTNIRFIFEILLRGPYIMHVLEKIARDKIKTLHYFDEVEIYLAYPIKLRDRFQIPISTSSLLYYTASGLNDYDIFEAEKLVESALKNKYQIVSFLETQKIWTQLLFIYNPNIYDDIDNLSENIQRETEYIITKYNLHIFD